MIADADAQDFVDILMSSLICGATVRVAAEFAVATFYRQGTGRSSSSRKPSSKPYQPRFDPALATPRLPEREWWPLRNWILRRDGFECRYCGDEAQCADHVIPLSRGGSNDENNLVACCLPCNSSKSDRLLSEWKGRYCGWL